MNAEMINKIDWGKLFMGFFVGLTFLLQQYHAMKLEEVKSVLVPRPEYEQKVEKAMDKEEILDAFRDFSKRIEDLEGKE